MPEAEIREVTPDQLQYLDNVLDDVGVSTTTRRGMLKHAVVGAAAMGALGPVGSALAAGRTAAADDTKTIVTTAVTAEALAVTLVTAAVKAVPGTPAGGFLAILKAVNGTEFDHYKALVSLGAKPLTTKFWIPDAALGPNNVNLFKTLELAETIFVDAYLLGITLFARAKNDKLARYAGEILGTEAEHRVLARYAETVLNGLKEVPNNKGFETFTMDTTAEIVGALEAAGFGFGKQGAMPGQFVDFPGDPVANGTGTKVIAPAPA